MSRVNAIAPTGHDCTHACTPPGPPLAPRCGVSTHRSHFCERPMPWLHWMRDGTNGQAPMHIWQPMHRLWSIIRTLPNLGFGLFALIGVTGQTRTHGASGHWWHWAMWMSFGQLANEACWICMRDSEYEASPECASEHIIMHVPQPWHFFMSTRRKPSAFGMTS